MINAVNIDQLVPDFLYDTGLLMLAVLDVDGRVLKVNRFLEKKSTVRREGFFVDALKLKSKYVFEETLDNIISSPKQNHRVKLQFTDLMNVEGGFGFWEFSVMTDANMDITGIIGLGIDTGAMNPLIEIDGLIDVLGLGRITLNSSFEIIEGDAKPIAQFGLDVENFRGSNLLELFPNLELQASLEMKEFDSDFFRVPMNIGASRVGVIGIKDQNKYHLFVEDSTSIDLDCSSMKKPFQSDQIEAIPGAVWVLNSDGVVIQLNKGACHFSQEHCSIQSKEGTKLVLPGFVLDQKIKEFQAGLDSTFIFQLRRKGQNSRSFTISFGELTESSLDKKLIVVQVNDSNRDPVLDRLKLENKRLKELAMSPSHILRSPLSSMLGLLDLIDQEQLDIENKKYFSYLKPLATQLDDVIRTNAKKMSSLD